MNRLKITPRKNWRELVENIGFAFHTIDNETYWDESVAYSFTMNEIDKIERVTNELNELILNAVGHVIDNKLYDKLGIPDYAIPYIEKSWEEELPSIYGRLDFGYHPESGELKLYEFNADTPTSLYESSVVQWEWLQDFDSKQDQFNSIHERLIDYWKFVKPYLKSDSVHFAATEKSPEDIVTTLYMCDTAFQAGLKVKYLNIEDIGYNKIRENFLDLDNIPMVNIFKLYPWEWLLYESFGKYINLDREVWIEPAWKMVASNKALLAILWELNPEHPNLLRTEFELFGNTYCKKPFISREGANITLLENNKIVEETDGEYGEEGFIYQEYFPLPDFDGNYPLIGCWLINQESAGMGIRENNSLITGNFSRFVPHFIDIKG